MGKAAQVHSSLGEAWNDDRSCDLLGCLLWNTAVSHFTQMSLNAGVANPSIRNPLFSLSPPDVDTFPHPQHKAVREEMVQTLFNPAVLPLAFFSLCCLLCQWETTQVSPKDGERSWHRDRYP